MTATGRAGRAATTLDDLSRIVRSQGYRRLLGTRVAGQFGDGALQAGLASLVLFNPEQQPSALLVATALTVTVLPFTVVGPFAGVILDRWRRRDVLLVGNAVRIGLVLACALIAVTAAPVAALYGFVLAALSLNRFVLAGLGAALPHTVPQATLVPANAMTPTLGTGAFAVGAVAGGAVRAVAGAGVLVDAGILLLAALAYAVATVAAARIPGDALGPDERSAVTVAQAAGAVGRDIRAGAAHVWARRGARDSIGVVGAHRFAFGLLTVATILLARGHLAPAGADAAAATGSAVGVLLAVGAATALGALSAAVLTPPLSRALSRDRGPGPGAGAANGRGGDGGPGGDGLTAWSVLALSLAALVCAVFALRLTTWEFAVGGFGIGLAGQAVKIVADTRVQTEVTDAYRGRAFAFYDVVYNGAGVLGALLAVLVVPADGYSRGMWAALAAGYLAVALLLAASRPRSRPPDAHPRSGGAAGRPGGG